MSRSGYSEDYDEMFPNAVALYRRSVKRAIDGKRGQAFLGDLLKALDAMPAKRLIAEDLQIEGEVCAIGALGMARGINMIDVDAHDARRVAGLFGIAESLAREVVFENDEAWGYWKPDESPEDRWSRMREWVAGQVKP